MNDDTLRKHAPMRRLDASKISATQIDGVVTSWMETARVTLYDEVLT
jgi:hypothetical protein